MGTDSFQKNGTVTISNGTNGLIPNNKSNQKLVTEDYLDVNSTSRSREDIHKGGVDVNRMESVRSLGKKTKITKMQWITVLILFYVNLINYMDRFTLAGILDRVKCNFEISNAEGGLLQTVFVISYMIFAPMFGYLGDRYSRRYIMIAGVFLWCLTTFLGSFMDKSFTWFVVFRAMVGIGEASYSTIAPTIISDMFIDDNRSKMLAVFYFAIPVGSGLGYIVGSETAKLFDDWRYALRVTPILGIIAVMLIYFVMVDPMRGEIENSANLKPTSWTKDVKALVKNPSFMLSNLGFTCVTFVAGALAWWGPIFITYGLALQNPDEKPDMDDVSLKFGIIAMTSGLIGVPFGSVMAQKLRVKNPRADPLICAFGLLVSTPLILAGAVMAQYNTIACFTLVFFGEVFLNLNWSIVADILLYVVIPTRRSTAEAFQILLSHAFGDAGSPYLVGIISDTIKTGMLTQESSALNSTMSNMTDVQAHARTACQMGFTIENPRIEFTSLQYALFITSVVEVLGGIFFLMTAWYIVADKTKADRIIANCSGGHLMTEEGSSSQTEDEDEDERQHHHLSFS